MYRNILNKIIIFLIHVSFAESNPNFLIRSLLLNLVNPLVLMKLGDPRCNRINAEMINYS
jgi:hypothetical protein